PSTSHSHTLSLHDALPISLILPFPLPFGSYLPISCRPSFCSRHNRVSGCGCRCASTKQLALLFVFTVISRISIRERSSASWMMRSEEHTSELQSRFDLVCR